MSRFFDWDDIEAAAEAHAGNWRRFESFGWWDKPEDAPQWCLVYTSNRDSGLLDQSNQEAINAILAPYLEADTDDPDIRSESHGHWACGWVSGFAIRVYAQDGTITPAFRAWCGIQARLADYPVLDEEDYSRREYEATLENIESVGHRLVREDAPEDWPSQCFSWFWENHQGAVESRDDSGGYPSDEEIEECLEALDLLEPEEEEAPTHFGGCTPTRSR
jgi:hypothetical protein